MKFEDDTQNLKARMAIIHGLVIAILAVLGARLYFLQVVNGDYYAERAENQRVRHLRIPAPRGAIFDRNGKLLVDSRSTYNIILSGEDMKGKDLNELVEKKYIPQMPAAPFGMKLQYDANSGKVSVVKQ